MIKSVRSAEERKPLIEDDGNMRMERLLPKDEVKNVGMFSRVSLHPGKSVDYHVHNGNMESYYFLEGSGIYNDNGTEVKISAGDVTYTKDGNGHGLTNTGESDLVFIAVIVDQ